MRRTIDCPNWGPSWLATALLLVATGCGGEGESPAEPNWPDRWHVSGGFVRDADGRAVILRGMNLANAHKSPPYFGFHQPQDYVRLRDEWGFNAIRFLVTWSAIEPSEGQYDDGYLAELATRIGWARDAGLLVVLDMHQDVYGEGFGFDGAPRWTCGEEHYQAFEPTSPWFMNYADEHVVACFDGLWNSATLRAQYAAAWEQVALRLAADEAVIGFDVMNEPYWGSQAPTAFESGALSSFYEEVVAAVRERAPAWIAFLEPSAGRNLGIPTALSQPSFGDVAYAPHCYDPAAESGEGFNPAGRNGLILRIGLYGEEAAALGAALWIGEYGGVADDPGITEYMDAVYDGAGQVAGGTMYWAYDRDDGYAPLRPDGSEKPELLDAIVRPAPTRVAGTPSFYGYDEQTGVFSVGYTPLAAVLAPTVLSLPKRAFPSGFDVQCGGCRVELKPGEAWLHDVVSGGGEVQVTVSPR